MNKQLRTKSKNADDEEKEIVSHLQLNYPKLYPFEALICKLAWTCLIFYGIWNAFVLSQRFDVQMFGYEQDYFVHSKYQFIGAFWETADWEWEMYYYWINKLVLFPTIFYLMVMRVAETLVPKHRFLVSMMFTLCGGFYLFGFMIFVLLTEMLIMLLCAVITRNSTCQWICYIGLVVHCNTTSNINWLVAQFGDNAVFSVYVCACGMGSLRTMSFCLEICKQDQSSKKSFFSDLIALLEFQFYFPLFFGGPIFTYAQFSEQKTKPPVVWSFGFAMNFFFQFCRYGIWFFVITFYLHYLYLVTIHNNIRLIENLSVITLVSLALVHDQHFCLKYFVLYGLPAVTASSDGLDVPGVPHCVVGKFQFTQMWRYFDKGLHKWLFTHIFLPLGGSKPDLGFWRKLLNLVLPFAFIWAWHGMYKSHLIWAFVNAVGIIVERTAKNIYKTQTVKKFEQKYISPAWSRRICGIIATFTFNALIISNLYFVVGDQSSDVIARIIYTTDYYQLFIVHLILYGGIQSSMEDERRKIEQRMKVKTN